jgi:acyl carrier protein
MTAENESKLSEIVRSVLQLPDDVDVSRARQLGVETWDSLAHVSLMLAIESEFDVTIDVADQLGLTSYPAIRLYLEGQGV